MANCTRQVVNRCIVPGLFTAFHLGINGTMTFSSRHIFSTRFSFFKFVVVFECLFLNFGTSHQAVVVRGMSLCSYNVVTAVTVTVIQLGYNVDEPISQSTVKLTVNSKTLKSQILLEFTLPSDTVCRLSCKGLYRVACYLSVIWPQTNTFCFLSSWSIVDKFQCTHWRVASFAIPRNSHCQQLLIVSSGKWLLMGHLYATGLPVLVIVAVYLQEAHNRCVTPCRQ